jgi:hypothetical protein
MDICRGNGLVVDCQYETQAPYVFSGTTHEEVSTSSPTALTMSSISSSRPPMRRRRRGAAWKVRELALA